MPPRALQAQIDAAKPGATVRVPPGAHLGTVVIDKPLTLIGEGFESVLDGEGDGPVITVSVAPGEQVTLHGLRVRNGAASAGAGICFRLGQLNISRCMMEANLAESYGGGALYASGQRLRVDRCEVRNNGGRQGGAVLLDGEVDATFTSTLIVGGWARYGGALRLKEGARCLLEGCTFADNAVGEGGEGSQIYLSGTTSRAPRLEMYNCVLSGDAPVIARSAELPGSLAGARVLVPEGARLDGVSELVVGTPRFRHEGIAPYALDPSSPAIGRGDPSRVKSERDLLGHPRVRGEALELGAYALVEVRL